MATFNSEHAPKIWDNLYTVYIPEQITLDPEHIRRYGTYITQNKQVDEMLKTNLTMVKIPIATILNYYDQGIEVQIPSREDMVTMHKHIELYLGEWKEYIRTSIHGNIDAQNHKDLITTLEKLSKYIYEKCKPREVIDNLFLNKKVNFGILNPIAQAEEKRKVVEKPDYQGIGQLIKKKRPLPNGGSGGDSGGRF